MLRKRSRPVHKDQSQGHLIPDSASETHFPSDVLAQKPRNSSLFSVPGPLVGFTAKGLSDYESAKSPTSPLDPRVFSNPGPLLRSPRSGLEGQPQKTWDCSSNNKVGLGIVDSLNDGTKPCGKVFRFSEGRNILFGSQMGINIPFCQTRLLNSLNSSSMTPRSLPKNYSISPLKSPKLQSDFSDVESGPNEIKLETEMVEKTRPCLSYSDRSLTHLHVLTGQNPLSKSKEFWSDAKITQQDSGSSPNVTKDPNFVSEMRSTSPTISVGADHGFIGPLSTSEIELSEDYTCVITHGPNPRTTHIYGNCILESHSFELVDCNKKEDWGVKSCSLVEGSDDYHPPYDFLSFCHFCKKKLEEGEDIYMYRGEKAFCSSSCRSQEILFEEEEDKPAIDLSDPFKSSSHEDIFSMGMAVSP